MENRINHNEQMYAYWLNSLPGIGGKTIDKLLAVYSSPEEFYHQMKVSSKLQPTAGWYSKEVASMRGRSDEGEFEKRPTVLSEKQLEMITSHIRQWDVAGEYDKLLKSHIRFLTMQDQEYPKHLKDIPDPPYGMFVKGNMPSDEQISVAIVGARECSEYGQYIARELGGILGARGIQIISGMARGIDGISQMAALEAGGTSYGVLGCGVDICYPAGNRALYQRLIQAGGILSSYPPGTQPQAALFPPRNRIVSGLADVVVVVEARQKSGTLITVDMALEQGREVYCIPGRLTDRLSDGCNKLIKQGAGILLSPEDFLADLENLFPDRAHWSMGKAKKAKKQVEKKESSKNTDEKVVTLDSLETRVLEQLDFMPQSVEQIRSRISPAPSYAQTLQILMRLTLTSAVVQAAPGYFIKKTP